MEGQRMFDLRRWGEPYAAARINGFVNGEGAPAGGGAEKTRRSFLAAAEPFVQKHMWYPIPTEQIDLSKVAGQPKLTQNTGW
jgi:hypothetical protein